MDERHVAQSDERPEVDSLIDFVYGIDEENTLQIDIAVRDDGKCAVFYNKPFKSEISWLEFNLETCMLYFVLDNGDMRDAGLPVTKSMSKNMQNTHQMLMVLLDDKSGEEKEAEYLPLIIHRK